MSLSEKPSDCEVTISLIEDIKSDIREPGVLGLYGDAGTYHHHLVIEKYGDTREGALHCAQ